MLLHLLFFFIQENVFLKNFLIGRKLLFVLVSAIQQHESVIIIHIYSPSGAFLSPHPAPLGHHRVPGCAPCVIYGMLLSYTYPTMIECYAAS